MDVYPRSKTWPYMTVVGLLFLLALWYPHWWVSWEIGTAGVAAVDRGRHRRLRLDGPASAGAARRRPRRSGY